MTQNLSVFSNSEPKEVAWLKAFFAQRRFRGLGFRVTPHMPRKRVEWRSGGFGR